VLIFIKNPRTGGTSLLRGIGESKKIITIKSPSRVFDFKSKNPDLWKKSIKFSIVRNPYTKVISGYSFHKAVWGMSLYDTLKKFTEPHDFWTVENLKETKSPKEWDKYSVYEHVCLPQSSFLFDKDGSFLCDEIIRFEYLEEQLTDFLLKNGIKIDLPHINQSFKRKRDYDFSEREKKLIQKIFRKDFINFRYKF